MSNRTKSAGSAGPAWALGLALGLAWPGPPSAAAQPETEADDTARLHFEAGSNLYAAGDFDGAAREFEAAYELSGRPQLLYNMYVAWRDAGDVRRGADALERYLEEVPDAPERVTLEARLESMKAQIAERDAAEAAAREAETAENTVPVDDEPSGLATSLPWVVGGVGVAAIVAGAITGGVALSLDGDLTDDCPGDTCPADRADDVDRLGALATATDVLLIGGAALVVTGVVLHFVGPGRRRGDRADDTALRPFGGCGASGCLAGVSGRFR